MLSNNRDDKYEGQEDSEYHFSDEEVSYEVETESPKTASAREPKKNLIGSLTQSKRMVISLVVFLALVFIVYKMVTPSSSTLATEITAPPTVAGQNVVPKTPVPAVAASVPQNAVVPAATPHVLATPMEQITQTMPQQVGQPAVSQAAAAPQVQTSPIQQLMTGAAPVQTIPPAAVPQVQASNVPPMPAKAISTMLTQQPQVISQPLVSTQQLSTQQQAAPQQPQNIPPAQPGITEVIQAPPTTPANNANAQVLNGQLPSGVASGVTAMMSDNEKLIYQLQSNYQQKLHDFATQNKALQDQIQALNTRVVGMETQMNQLIQALTHPYQGENINAAPAQPQPSSVEPKVTYNVQAIIPGRAWLRSENGETVTVAEGDVIRGMGRITKIDPYDGVVEINTGNKTLSLSYGNGS